jgi:exodeoxyribonuclease VII small subunit
MAHRKNKDFKFDELMTQLETLVQNLESDDINLDDAVQTYKEAIKLIGLSQKKLNEAEADVQEVIQNSENILMTQKLD